MAGYTRLKSVYNRLGVSHEKLIKGLIIYSHQDCAAEIDKGTFFSRNIEEYIEFYKLGISLPHIALPDP